MRAPCPACGGDSFGPYGPFMQTIDHEGIATIWGFECDTVECTIMYFVEADTREEAKQKWETRV